MTLPAANISSRLWQGYQIGPVAMVALLLLLPMMVACSMSNSSEFYSKPRLKEFACDSDAGAYNLGKSVIRIKVTKLSQSDVVVENASVHAVPDHTQAYCLDYRPSPTHKEKFQVHKTNGLLQQINSLSEDKSVDIAKTLVQTIFTGLSGNSGFPRARSGVQPGQFESEFSGEFDPFDEYEAATLNDGLNDFGICLVLMEAEWSQHLGYSQIPDYCENPLSYVGNPGGNKAGMGMSLEEAITASEEYRHVTPERIKYTRGVLYRPRLTYTLMVFVKSNIDAKYPGEGVSWDLRKQESVSLENRSPIMSIGVNRTFFAQRNTLLTFDSGALVDVEINKESELAGFVQIPLAVVNSLIKLPTNLVQVRINNTNNRAAIIDAQTQLIAIEEKRKEITQRQAEIANDPLAQGNPLLRSQNASIGAAFARSTISTATAQDNSCIERFCTGLDAKTCKNFCP